MAQDRSRYEPEVVNQGLVIDVEPYGRKWNPDELVLQVPRSGGICKLSGPVYEGSVGDASSGSLVDIEGRSLAYVRRPPLTHSKPDEQADALRSNEDVEMRDVEDDEVEEEAVLDELDGRTARIVPLHGLKSASLAADSEEEDEEQGEEDDELPEALANGDKNSQLAVGFKGDRSYVVRGNNIGVFRHSGDQDVKYYATIGNIANQKGVKFNPKKVPRPLTRNAALSDSSDTGHVARLRQQDDPVRRCRPKFALRPGH